MKNGCDDDLVSRTDRLVDTRYLSLTKKHYGILKV
jgi:hypothetical protein